MFDRSRILTAVVTVGLAVAAGHFVQSTADAPQSRAEVETVPEFKPLPTRPGSSVLLSRKPASLSQPTIASPYLRVPTPPAGALADLSLPATTLKRVAAPRDVIQAPPSDNALNLDGFGMACGSDITAEPAPGGLIRLTLRAACDPGAVAGIDHDGVSFNALLGPSGELTLDIPAFRSDARLRVTLGSAGPVDLRVSVPDAALYDRVALVGPDAATMSIHALEFGAGPGSAGHVSAGRTDPSAAPGGTVVRLGDPDLPDPLVAEIYSYPTGRDLREGTVRLSVAARVTDANCGSIASARTIHATGGGVPPRIADLSVPMPDCRAAGRILVLKNLVEDLKIAHN